MKTTQKLIAAQSIIADMSRLANETADEAGARIAFFGEDCDKLAVLSRSAAKLIEVIAADTTWENSRGTCSNSVSKPSTPDPMPILLTKNDAMEVSHKLCVLADTPDLQEDYRLTQEQANNLRDSLPHDGGSWECPAWAAEAVKEEMQDHCRILSGIADDARTDGQAGQALRIAKQAKRLTAIFSTLSK